MNRWVGKVALVTGASSGIGAEIAKTLVKHGLIVVGLARRVDKMKDMEASLSKEMGSIHPIKADVSSEKEVHEAFQWLRSNLGTVDILINCAGIGRYYPLTGEGKVEDLKQLFGVNGFGLINCTSEALKLMNEKGIDDGHIIHINSVAGHNILQFNGHYVHSALKHGVRVLTEGLRRELVQAKSKIRVTSISPGLVNTDMVEDFKTPGMDENFEGKPILEPKDVADGVVYALSAPPHVQIHELTIKPVGEEF